MLYCDISCQLSADEVGGWTAEHVRRRKLSAGVTWNSDHPEHRVYFEQDVEELISELERAPVVVGYNCLAFDFEILRGYRSFQLKRTLDLFADLLERTGQKISLAAIWKGTFKSDLDSDGLDRMELWKTGQLPLLAESCANHLRRIRQVREFGAEHGRIAYVNRFGDVRRVKVDWRGVT